MSKEELLPCPFCGCKPSMCQVHEHDDRRYMRIEVECCVSVYANICYGTYKNMSAADIKTSLEADVTKNWNERFTADVPECGPFSIDHDKDGDYVRCGQCNASWPDGATTACESALIQLAKRDGGKEP